jgi:sialate O-acetylesterase
MKNFLFYLLIILFIAPNAVLAEVHLANILQSNMVLQQQSDVAIWGWANPSEKVTVTTSWDTNIYQAKSTDNANFKVILKTPKAGGPYTITIKGDNTIVLSNILIGEVWVCAGQSNMEWSAQLGVKDALAELPKCYNNQMRLFRMPKTTSATPQDDCRGNWQICDSANMRHFSAVGYFFGKKLYQNLTIPIGLIDLSWGGSYIESWIAEDFVNLYPDTKISAQKMIYADWWPSKAGYIYNAMVAPLSNMAIGGVIWYQGESNRHFPSTYYKLTHMLVESWRGMWQKDFPFYYAQIAPFNYKDSTNMKAALIREMQTRAMDIPKSGMIVTTDLVDNIDDIHPAYKQEVGNRLANWALRETYGVDIGLYKSPRFSSMIILGDKLLLSFINTEGELVAKGGEPKEFYIAGDDRIFYKAKAVINGENIEVSSEKVPNPKAVRFAFGDMPQPNVFNKIGLPIIPFRTDNWDK